MLCCLHMHQFWVAKTFQKSFGQLVVFANCLVTFQSCCIFFGKQLPLCSQEVFIQGNLFCQSLVPLETASGKVRSYNSKISHFQVSNSLSLKARKIFSHLLKNSVPTTEGADYWFILGKPTACVLSQNV